MVEATKEVNGSLVGTVRYGYSGLGIGQRTERIEYDAQGGIVSWYRYETDGLLTYRVDERYDDDNPVDGIDATDPWRLRERRVYGPGAASNLLLRRWWSTTRR
jgi:hypothetical protein